MGHIKVESEAKKTNFSGVFVLLLLIFFTVSFVKNYFKVREAKRRIEKARQKVEQLKVENAEIKRKIAAVQTPFYMETQLRDKLGMIKAGETVLILPDEATLRTFAPKVYREEETLPDPSWRQWWKLFQ